MLMALDATAPIDDLSILAVPGLTDGPTKAVLLQHCQTMEDRVVVLDGINSTTPTVAAVNGADITPPLI